MVIENLSLEEKIGQKLMVGLCAKNTKEIVYDLIVKHKIGGVLVYKDNYKNYEEMIDLINYIKKTNSKFNKIPIFIAIDQEGGRVNRMPPEILNLPSCNKIAKTNDENFVKESASLIAKILKKSGINMDFAPVLDIKRFDDNQAIGDRAFCDDKEIVAKFGIDFMKELQKEDVISVIKHFPGHGATKTDSHFMIPIVNKKIEDLENEDEYPFIEAINNGADTLLVSHLLIKKISKNKPITMSKKFIKEYLRNKFDGVIISDDMRMGSLRISYGKYTPIIKAFLAGNDIVLFKYLSNDKIYKKLHKVVQKDVAINKEINESVEKIIKLKEKYNINDNLIKSDLDICKYNEEIKKIRDTVLL